MKSYNQLPQAARNTIKEDVYIWLKLQTADSKAPPDTPETKKLLKSKGIKQQHASGFLAEETSEANVAFIMLGMFFLLISILYLMYYVYNKGHYFSREFLRKNRDPSKIYKRK